MFKKGRCVMNILGIIEDLEKFIVPIKDFFVTNVTNPIFWIVIVGFIVGISLVTYGSKTKDK